MQDIVFGAMIVGFLVFEPHGLAEMWNRIRRVFCAVAVPEVNRAKEVRT